MKTDGGDGQSSSPSESGVNTKYLVVILVVLLEVVAALYLYSNPVGGQSQIPIVTPTSKTTTTSITSTTEVTTAQVDKVSISSATITDDALNMDVRNLGPNATNLLAVADVCSPGFKTCYSYSTLSGATYKLTFDLPAGKTFMANLTGVCTIAIPSCKSYLPVANATYYFQITVGFTDGSKVTVPVSAIATNTWSPYPNAVLGIAPPSLEVNQASLTGQLNVTVTVNGSLPYASWTTKLYGYLKPLDAFSGTLLTNSTGCMGSTPETGFKSSGKPLNVTFTGDCTQPVTVTTDFYTVLTGITAGTAKAPVYYSVAICDTTAISSPKGYPDHGAYATYYFALWVKGTLPSVSTKTTARTTSTATTSHA